MNENNSRTGLTNWWKRTKKLIKKSNKNDKNADLLKWLLQVTTIFYSIFWTGVGILTRKVGNSVRPVVELTQESDGKLKLSSKSTFRNASISFNLGEEFDEETLDGRKVKSTITLEGNKLIQIQKNGKEMETIREFTPEEMHIVRNIW